MALFAKKLHEEIAALKELLAVGDRGIDELRADSAIRMASHLNEISLRDEQIRTLIADNAAVVAELKGENTILDRDASRWRSIWPHGAWVRTTTIESEGGDQLHVFQPRGGQFSEGSVFGARVLSTRRDLHE